jgi:hypothetical protein
MAFSDTNPVGYLKVNFGEAQTEITEGNSLEIHRIYVLKLSWQKRRSIAT